MTSKKNALLARPVLTMVLGLAGPLTNVAVAQQIPNQKSVVRVTGCDGSNGTGFVWGEPTLVVTALHVVAACGNVVVHTEDRVDRAATILKVSLEGDLALLRLAGPLGLPPFKEVVPGEPTISQPFKLFSYPNAVPTMTGAEIHFAQGRDRMVTTLEEAFRGVVGYKDLTAGDSYPKASA